MVVGVSAIIGSLIPILPYFILPVKVGNIVAIILSIIILFAAGAIKAKIIRGNWKTSGFEMAVIGTLAALAGYLIGSLLGRIYG